MSKEQYRYPQLALLRLQSWLSPAFPTGSYSYSHGLEWAVEAGYIKDRESLVDWLEADLGRMYSDTPIHPLLRRLQRAVERYELPRDPFIRLIRLLNLEGPSVPISSTAIWTARN